jgi:hypothetical protein
LNRPFCPLRFCIRLLCEHLASHCCCTRHSPRCALVSSLLCVPHHTLLLCAFSSRPPPLHVLLRAAIVHAVRLAARATPRARLLSVPCDVSRHSSRRTHSHSRSPPLCKPPTRCSPRRAPNRSCPPPLCASCHALLLRASSHWRFVCISSRVYLFVHASSFFFVKNCACLFYPHRVTHCCLECRSLC